MKKKKSVGMILVLVALVGVGMNFHHPVTPTLFTELGLPSRIFGTSFAIMCFTTFLTSVFWGEISDRKGRIKTFMIGCIAYGIAQFLLGFSTTEFQVLLARALSGAFAAATAVPTMAYIIDISTEETRAKNLSMYTAISLSTLAVGYLIGGFLGTLNTRLALNFQAVFMIATGIFAWLTVEDYVTEESEITMGKLLVKVNPVSSFLNARPVMNRIMILFLIVTFVTAFASSAYDNAFNYYLKDQLNFIPAYNGILKGIIGLVGFISNFTINMWILKKEDICRSLALIVLLCGVSAIAAVMSGTLVLFIVFNLIFFSVNAIYQPIVQSLSVLKQDPSYTGIISGLFNGIKSIGNVFGSLVAGFIYGYGFTLPFILAAGLFLFSEIFILMYRSAVRKA